MRMSLYVLLATNLALTCVLSYKYIRLASKVKWCIVPFSFIAMLIYTSIKDKKGYKDEDFEKLIDSFSETGVHFFCLFAVICMSGFALITAGYMAFVCAIFTRMLPR